MRELNRQYRGIDRTTDVLSFPQQDSNKLTVTSNKIKEKDSSLVTRHSLLLLGDIVINLPRVMSQASEHGMTFKEELRWLLIHGLLHLIGYDHERSRYHEKKMRIKEMEMLNALQTVD